MQKDGGGMGGDKKEQEGTREISSFFARKTCQIFFAWLDLFCSCSCVREREKESEK